MNAWLEEKNFVSITGLPQFDRYIHDRRRQDHNLCDKIDPLSSATTILSWQINSILFQMFVANLYNVCIDCLESLEAVRFVFRIVRSIWISEGVCQISK